MKCPYCGTKHTEVVETRDSEELATIRRRRSCLACNRRFTTYERVETVNLYVVKKDGRREQFDREKLKLGVILPTEKTTVTIDQVDRIVAEIEQELRSRDSSEVRSLELGELVSQQLKKIDKVAYIRFSAVFKR